MRTILATLIFAPAIVSSALAAQAPARADSVAAGATVAPVAALLTRAIEQEVREQQLPALSIAIVTGDGIVWARGFGSIDTLGKVPATAATVYRAGSLTSLVTAAAVAKLAEGGRIDLDAPVTRYVSDFQPHNPFGAPITLRQLLAHRAGLVREAPVGGYSDTTGASLASAVLSLDSTTLVARPGSRYKFSNAGIAVAGLAVERASKVPFASYAEQQVLAPLGMRESAFELTPELEQRLATGFLWSYDGHRTPARRVEPGERPALSLYTTVTDLGRLAASMLARGPHPAFVLGATADTLAGAHELRQSGGISGYASELALLPTERIGVVVITSLDAANGATTRIATLALRAMLANRHHSSLPELATTGDVVHAGASRLAGRYASGRSALDLVYVTAPSDSAASSARLTMRFDSGGTRATLRTLGDTLIRDDRFGFGTRVLPRGDTLVIGRSRWVRAAASRPSAPSAKIARLVGEYGPDHAIFYILENHGRLNALADWFFQAPLTHLTDSTFVFPRGSRYDSEPVRFAFDRDGAVTGVRVGGTWLPRRAIGPASGNQLRVTPVRPIADLEREARAASPPVESGKRTPDLVELVTLDSTIHLEIRYATEHNFLGTRFYSEPRAFLQRPAAEALVRAHRRLETLGYGILVHDSYRPWYVTKMFWDAVPPPDKIFVADPAEGSRHNRGAAADITLYDRATGKPVEMPGTYDETSDRSFANYPGGTSLQRWYRGLLRQAMEAEGFTVYHAEWWHFDYRGWNEYPIANIPFSDIREARKASH